MSRVGPRHGVKAKLLAMALASHYEREFKKTRDNAAHRTACRMKALAFREFLHAMETGESVLDLKPKRRAA